MKREETIVRIELDFEEYTLGILKFGNVYAYTNLDTKILDNEKQFKVGDKVVTEITLK